MSFFQQPQADTLMELSCRQVRSSGWIVGKPHLTPPAARLRFAI